MPDLFIDIHHHDWHDEARAAAGEQRHDQRLIEQEGHYDPQHPPRPAVDHRGPERDCNGCGHTFRPNATDRRATLCDWCATGTDPLTDPTKGPR